MFVCITVCVRVTLLIDVLIFFYLNYPSLEISALKTLQHQKTLVIHLKNNAYYYIFFFDKG